jgi:glucokinase
VTPAPFVLAIDIGGTKIAVATTDLDGRLHRRVEVPTPTTDTGAGELLWATLLDAIAQVCDDGDPVGVGVGCGGPIRWPQGLVSPLNIPAWRDFPLRDRLRGRFPGCPIRVANDAIATAVGEHWRGAGRGARALLGVVVSTGVGGGLVVDGTVVQGPTGNAGHVGHIVVDPDGPHCACGGRGCLEAIARGPAVVRWATDAGWQPFGDDVADGRSLLAAARAGDAIALQAFERCGTALGVAFASAAHLLELDVIAVAGGMSRAGDLLLRPAREAFERHAKLEFVRGCRIVPATLGTDAGLVGASAFVAAGDQYWTVGAD